MYIRYQVYWEGYRSYMNRTDPSSFIKQIKFLYDMHSNAKGLSIYVINDKAEEIYDGPLNKIVIDGLAVNLNEKIQNNDNN
jgi:hypothetical protein